MLKGVSNRICPPSITRTEKTIKIDSKLKVNVRATFAIIIENAKIIKTK